MPSAFCSAIAALADPDVGAPAEGPGRDRARELLDGAADVLDAAARSIRRGTPVEVPHKTVDLLHGNEVLEGPARQAAKRLAGLLGEALEIAECGNAHRRMPAQHGPAGTQFLVRPTLFRLIPVIVRAVRRELRHDSPVFRHAVRLAAVATLGYLIAARLPLGHGYWAPIASVMVMRPDFHRTYARAVARLAGTLVGVMLATGVVRALGPDAHVFGALAVVSAGLSYTLVRTGYAYSQCFTAAYVVFLLGMGGQAWEQTVPERMVLTLLGGALAILAYAVFPAWETPRLPERLADWLAANGRYAAAVLRIYAEPTRERRADMRSAQLASRKARAAWQEAYDRAKQEPVRPRGLTSREAEEAQEALEGFERAATLMENRVPQDDNPFALQAEGLAKALETDTAQAAADMREHRNPDWGRVENALQAWEGAGARNPALRREADLQKRALEDLATAVSRTPWNATSAPCARSSGCGRPWRLKAVAQDPRTGLGDVPTTASAAPSWRDDSLSAASQSHVHRCHDCEANSVRTGASMEQSGASRMGLPDRLPLDASRSARSHTIMGLIDWVSLLDVRTCVRSRPFGRDMHSSRARARTTHHHRQAQSRPGGECRFCDEEEIRACLPAGVASPSRGAGVGSGASWAHRLIAGQSKGEAQS